MTFLHYPGGKARIADKIVARMDPHRVYVEPFSGTASVLLAKPRSPFEVLNDLDGRLVTTLRMVRDRGPELAALLADTPYSRGEYALADLDEDLDDLELARRVCVRVGQGWGRSGMNARQRAGGWRISIRRGTGDASTWDRMPERVLGAFERLRGVHLEALPALQLIDRYAAEPDAVIYLDPPYLSATRSPGIYALEMGTEEQHRELAAAIDDVAAHVLISGYHHPLYDELYGAWDRAEIAALSNHNGLPGADPRRTEVLWSNRPIAHQQRLELASATA